MDFHPLQLYHLYNRGNDRQPIFFQPENYLYFLRKMRQHVLPYADVLCYCLMPNHFHALLYTRDNLKDRALNASIATMLRSYTRAINRQEERTGSLFQQGTKAKPLTYRPEGRDYNDPHPDPTYPATCFHYIHQNPLSANLTAQLEEWPYSSLRDYAGLRAGTPCNIALGRRLLDLPADSALFLSISRQMIDPAKIRL